MIPVDPLGAALRCEVDRIATVDTLLVAVDVDGTIADIAPRPQDAYVLDDALAALRALAALPRTTVAVLSGRSHRELAEMVPLGGVVLLLGSHGAERSADLVLDASRARLRDLLVTLVEQAAGEVPGALAEPKPTGAALHVRLAPPEEGVALLSRLRARAAQVPGAHLRTGKAVLELSAVPTGKGVALDDLRTRCGADAVVYVGDDDTDEEALAVLREHDLGVKVGAGTTLASARVADPLAAVALLEALAVARHRTTQGRTDGPGAPPRQDDGGTSGGMRGTTRG